MFTYAEVANPAFRRTPTTSAVPRTASLTNVTNATPQRVIARTAGDATVPQQQRAFAIGNSPVTVATEHALNASFTPVGAKENAPNALFNASTVSAAVRGNIMTEANADEVGVVPSTIYAPTSTNMARPKRKAAVDAPKTWESEKKKPRGSKKARVDATDQNNAKVADAEEYFATPPPGTPPPANAFAPVRQPAPRKNNKFRSYDVIWSDSDADSSTLSNDTVTTQGEHQPSARDALEEDFVRKRREMKARKKALQSTGAETQAPAGPVVVSDTASHNVAASSSAAPVAAKANKPSKRRGSSGKDRHRLVLHKKGKGKERTRSPSHEQAGATKSKGKKRALTASPEPRKKGKRHLASHEATDTESQRDAGSGDEASEELEDCGSEFGGEFDSDAFVNAEVVDYTRSSVGDSDAPQLPTRRLRRAAKRFQEETVTIVRSPDRREGASAPGAEQNGALAVSHPPPVAGQFADALPPLRYGLRALPGASPRLLDGALLTESLPRVTDSFTPLPGTMEPSVAFSPLHKGFSPVGGLARQPPQAPHGATESPSAFPPLHAPFSPLARTAQAVPQAPQDDSIEITNPSHPKLKDQPLPVRMALRLVWARAGGAILKNNLLMEHTDRNGVVGGLGVQAALDLGLPHMADRLRDTQSPYYSGWYRLTMERMSALRGNMKAAIKEALQLYNVPPHRKDGATEAVVEYLFSGRRYIFPDPEMPHWETAYMHPAIVTALRCLLFETIKPAEMPIAEYDPVLFNPPDDAYGFEMEIPAPVLASVATLIYYALDCCVRDPNGKNQPDITEDKYRREYAFHYRSMENLRQMPRIRHERLNWLYNAVHSAIHVQDHDALTWG